MKPNLFKYSMLTVGIVTAMGAAHAATSVSYNQEQAFTVKNIATATYNVTGNPAEQKAESNEVTINVTETGAFSLLATGGASPTDDINENIKINPQTGATVDFTHTLANKGNVTDTYTINLANEAGDNFNYNIANSTITYQKLDANGAPVGSPVTIANGGNIQLAPGQSATIIVNAAADTNTPRVIGNTGILDVTATSAYLTGKGQTATATNTDTAVTVTPIYAITKSAQTNLGTKVIDLNNDNAYVDYTITVQNQGTANGTAVTIEDALPNGLVAIKSGEPNYLAPTTTGGSSNVTPVISADGKKITVTGQDIAQGNTITIKFRAKKAAGATTSSNFVNYAVVKDDTDGDGIFDLVDSSGDANDTATSENNYEDPTKPTIGKDNNTAATVTAQEQTRAITISPGLDKEVALQSTANGYTYVIKNEGSNITEADAKGEVLFTVKPVTDITQITTTQVFVDTNNNGVLDTGETVLTANAQGEYDLNDAITAGLAPGQSVNIGVLVDTNGSGSNNGKDSDIGKSEIITVKVLPKTVVDGTPAPTDDISTTSTTTMQGIDLFKFQAAADCGTAPSTITNWVNSEVIAKAGQCAYYRLEATNTFSNKSVTNIALTDTLVDKLTYQSDFSSKTSNNSPVATSNISGQIIRGTFGTLVGKEVGTIYFSAKISQAGATVTP